MTHFYRVLAVALALCSFAVSKPVSAQSTYEQIRTILTTNCSPACHANTIYSFNIDDPASALYDSLLNADPKNPYARSQGYKLIYPGHPEKSFLLRKVANCISGDLALAQAEGSEMPEGGPALLDQEIELIRQWIIAGADETGNIVKKNIIDEYYTIGGIDKIEVPAPPKECEGFQIHMGPIFFEPGEEVEYFLRHDLNVPDSLEVVGLELFFNDESHHFILRKYRGGTGQSKPQGLLSLIEGQIYDGDKDYIMAWQDNQSFYLPNGTAYFWSPDEILDLNYHMFNYHNEILPGEVYINVYTQPKGSALKEMKSRLVNNFNINIPAGQMRTFSQTSNFSNKSIWTITSHTHKYGFDYNVYLVGPNNQTGRQVFDGTFDYSAGFDTGTYDWEHPPTVFYEPFLDFSDTINNGSTAVSLRDSVTYKNTGSDPVGFSFTTEGEMMIFYVQYVDGTFDIPAAPVWTANCTATYKNPCVGDTTTGILEFATNDMALNLYPNPTNGVVAIEYNLPSNATVVNLQVVSMLGEVVANLVTNEQQVAGNYAYTFDAKGNSQGIYFIRLSVDGKISSQKLIFAGN